MGGLYEMELASMSVGSKPIKLGLRKHAILDSGTNVLLVPTPIFDAVKEAFLGMCQAGAKLKGVCGVPKGAKSLLEGGCFSVSPAEAAAFPSLSLGITASGLTMPPSSYLRAGDPACASAAPGAVSLGVRDTGPTGFFIIGDTTMENYCEAPPVSPSAFAFFFLLKRSARDGFGVPDVAFDRKNARIGWAKRTDACGSV